jgi:hypothetical protein
VRRYAIALSEELAQFERPMPVMDEYDLLLKGTTGDTRTRMTQIMNLLLLAPDIQEAILLRGCDHAGQIPAERELRRLTSTVFWPDQRSAYFQPAEHLGHGRRAARNHNEPALRQYLL